MRIAQGLELVEFFDNAIFVIYFHIVPDLLELVEFFDNAILSRLTTVSADELELVEFFDNAIFIAFTQWVQNCSWSL